MPKHSAEKKKFGSSNVQAKVKGRGKFGGPQPNSGRKKGDLNRRTKMLAKVTDRHIRGKRLPLDIMIENMIHYQDHARLMQEELEDAYGEFRADRGPETMLPVLELLVKVGDVRMHAQKCACDAAPFIHAKLSSIAFTPKHAAPQDIADGKIEQARDDFRQLRSQQYVPPVIEGEAELVSEHVTQQQDEDEEA